MKSNLNQTEFYTYFFMLTSAIAYSFFKLYQEQNAIDEHELHHRLNDLQNGWKFLGRLKDESDTDWKSWKNFMNISWFYLIAHSVVSEIIRGKCFDYLKYWYISSSVAYVLINFGINQLLFILLQPILYTGIILSGRKKLSIWITSILLLILFNTDIFMYLMWCLWDTDTVHEKMYLILFGFAWIMLRCMSFCIDYVESEHKTNISSNLDVIINMFSYVLYLPLLLNGPIVIYEEFNKSFQVTNGNLWSKVKCFLWDMFIFQIYTFIMDLHFHYVYFYAMHSDIELVKTLSPSALCGAGLYMGFQFYLKYVISYGTTCAFARLDNIDAPPTPRCIARIYVYSQMWRYFDVGNYRFLVKYIHKPLLNYLLKIFDFPLKSVYKLIASLFTFCFIFLWHGAVSRIFVWVVINYVAIVVEFISKEVSQTQEYKWFKNKVLKSEAMEQRFKALICAPLLILSCISNFYLCSTTEIGHLYFKNLKSPTLFNFCFVGISVYCLCHVSIAFEDVPSRKDVKSQQFSVRKCCKSKSDLEKKINIHLA